MSQLSVRNNLLRARQYRRGRMWQRASSSSSLNPTAALNLPCLNFTSPASLLRPPHARAMSLPLSLSLSLSLSLGLSHALARTVSSIITAREA